MSPDSRFSHDNAVLTIDLLRKRTDLSPPLRTPGPDSIRLAVPIRKPVAGLDSAGRLSDNFSRIHQGFSQLETSISPGTIGYSVVIGATGPKANGFENGTMQWP